ncbi:Ger(x)C family spore germination protein [Alteribacillus sp. HJP-4]|uniref:Ger(x)C family spore germination protein n=1 Tax=Alteribacillus sp. HJP-4 TaxID=2775394 RepID=UPI0035CD39D5
MNKWVWLLFLIFILSGCAAKSELDEIAIVLGMGVDITNDNKTEVTVQVANPRSSPNVVSGGSGDGSSPVFTFSAKGDSVTDAINRVKNVVPRELFFSHINVMMLGEKYARKEGVSEIFSYVERDQELRSQFPLFVIKDSTGKEALTVVTPLDQFPTKAILDIVELSSGYIGVKKTVRINDLINWEGEEDRTPIILGLEVMAKDKNKNTGALQDIEAYAFKLDSMGVFKNGKFLKWLNEETATGWLFMNDYVEERTLHTVECEGGTFGIMLKGVSSDINTDVKNNQLLIDITIQGTSSLVSSSCKADIASPEGINELEQTLRKIVEQEVKKAVYETVELKTNYNGLAARFHRQHPDKWKKWKKNWYEHIEDSTLHIKSELTIETPGMRYNSAKTQR